MISGSLWLIYDQFGIIQVPQRSPILQTSIWSGTFFAVSYSKQALIRESTFCQKVKNHLHKAISKSLHVFQTRHVRTCDFMVIIIITKIRLRQLESRASWVTEPCQANEIITWLYYVKNSDLGNNDCPGRLQIWTKMNAQEVDYYIDISAVILHV